MIFNSIVLSTPTNKEQRVTYHVKTATSRKIIFVAGQWHRFVEKP
jgi:hypothetical protein